MRRRKTHCIHGHERTPDNVTANWQCRTCINESAARYSEDHWKEFHYRYRYGIALEQYGEMVKNQGGVCAVCKQPELEVDKRTGEPRSLHVDHDHDTGRIRKLLCGRCNKVLGQVKDDPELLRAMADYLECYQIQVIREVS